MTARPTIRHLAAALLAGLLLVPALQATAAHAGGSGIHTLTGFVRGRDGRGVPDAFVQFDTTRGRSDATGRYTVNGVPDGEQGLAVDAPCFDRRLATLTFAGDRTKNFTLDRDRDAFGHVCQERSPFLIATNTTLPLAGDDQTLDVTLPFPFPFYGQAKQHAFVSTNGYLTFSPRAAGTEDFRNGPLLASATPTDGVFAFWDDLMIDGPALVRSATFGTAPRRTFAIEWRDARLLPTTDRITVDLVLEETGRIEIGWQTSSLETRAHGDSATIGLRNGSTGSAAQAVTRSVDLASTSDISATEFTVNHPPVAKAGPDRIVQSGAGFTLDGSASTDPDEESGLVYRWTQTGGAAVTLQTPHKERTQVPGVAGPKTLTFQLQVIDPFGRKSVDSVTVQVKAPA